VTSSAVGVTALRSAATFADAGKDGVKPRDREQGVAGVRSVGGAGVLPRALGGRRSASFVLLAALGSLAVVAAFVPSRSVVWLPALAGVVAVPATAEGVLLQVRAGGLRGGPFRDPLVLLGIGLCLTVASEVLRAAESASNGYAEGVALTAYPFLIAGLVRLTRTRLKEGALDTLLLAAIVPAVVLALAWLPLADAIGRWSEHDLDAASWRTGIFLVVDVLAVAIIARLAVTFRGKPAAYQLLLGSAGCLLGAHVSRAVASITDLVPAPLGSQTLLIAGFALFGAAALHPSLRRVDARTRIVMLGRWHVTLLVLAVVAGPVYAVVRYHDRGGWILGVAVFPAVISLLVVGHLARMISERQRLEFTAMHDALTGLPNRVHFLDRLALLTGRGEEGLAVLFLDLDRFKEVNDTYGHDAGDEMLREVARRMRDCVRDGDLVARLGGDEFAMLLPAGADVDRSVPVGERMLARFSEPFHIAGLALTMSPSIGVALFPDHGADVEELLRNADAAMYAAKATGRNTVVQYRVGMETQANQRLVVEQSLRAAIDGRDLALHYQPKLDASTGRIVGVEALVRWNHPVHGLIPPAAFIPAAEQSGLVAPLGAWVLTSACTQAQEWRRAGLGDIPVSVNLSARQFELQSVPALVEQALTRSGLPPHLLELELTESIPMDRDSAVAAALQQLDLLGVRCAIDDFGTGYSNIGYLHEFPITTVKLDRSFVRTVDGSGDSPIVRAVIALAHSLGMRVVAEGVETESQLGFLQEHGCDELQGFLFSPGLPAGEMTALLRTGTVPGNDPWHELPWRPTAPVEAWDEKRLHEALWITRGDLEHEEEEDDDRGARLVVLGTASGFMVLPTLLGLGSAGGLPPQVQDRVTAAIGTVGAVAPREPDAVDGGTPAGTVAAAGAEQSRVRNHRDGAPKTQARLPDVVAAPRDDEPLPTAAQRAPRSTAQPAPDPAASSRPGRSGKAWAGNGKGKGGTKGAGNGTANGAGNGKSKGKSHGAGTAASGRGGGTTTGNGAAKAHRSGGATARGSGAATARRGGAKDTGGGAVRARGNGKASGSVGLPASGGQGGGAAPAAPAPGTAGGNGNGTSTANGNGNGGGTSNAGTGNGNAGGNGNAQGH
jgi:diguanylate cyclase (GGDEF)-like protein